MRYISFIICFVYSVISISQTIVNPVFDRTDHPELHVDKIEVYKDSTLIHCTLSMEANTWANISPNTFIEDIATEKKYTIIRSEGIPFSPAVRIFNNAMECKLIFVFPSINGAKKINLIENPEKEAFNIYGISLTESYEKSYRETELELITTRASFYETSGDTTLAIKYRREEIDATKYLHGIKSEPLIPVYTIASIMYDKFGYSEQAIDISKQEGLIRAELWGTSDWNHALFLRTLGLFYSHARNYILSIQTFKESIELFESLHVVDNSYALALRFIADDYHEIGDRENALICQKKCINVRRQLGDEEKYIDELINVLLSGSFDDMIYGIEVVIKELENLPDFISSTSMSVAKVQKQIASNLFMRNNNIAIEYCNKVLAFLDIYNKEDSEDYAEILALKCKCQRFEHLWDDAIVSGVEAKSIYDSLNVKSWRYAELLEALAWAYGQNYDYEKSIQLLMTAAEIYDKEQDWISMAGVYGTISQNYLWVAKLDSAEQYIKKSINVLNSHCDAEEYLMNEVGHTGNNSIYTQNHLTAIKLNINTTKANLFQTLASIFQAQGKYADAISTELEKGQIIESMNDDQLYASHLGTLSKYYMIDKQYSKAIECAEQGLILLKHEDKETVLMMLQLASIYMEAGNINKAIQYANKSVLISKSTNNNETAVSANSFLSFLYYINHDYEQLEKTSSETIESLKNRLFNKHVKMTNEQKKSIWREYGGIFNVYNSIIKNIAINGPLIAKVYDNVLFTKTIILEASTQKTTLDYSQTSWRDIQNHLSKNDIAIEFVCVPEMNYPKNLNKNENDGDISYYALVIDNVCQYPKLIPLCGDSEIDKLWLYFRNNDTDSAQCLAREFLWNPILNQFKHAKNIYFCPDGLLHIVPIENIIEDEDNLIDRNYNVYRLSSTKKILEKRQTPHYNSAVLFGDIDYNHLKTQLKKEDKEDSFSFVRGIIDRGGFEPLYNSKNELSEIADILKSKNVLAKLYMGTNGTEDRFTQLSDESVNIIHLATHGLYVNPVEAEKIKTENNWGFMGIIPNKRSIWDTINWEDISMTHSLLVMAGGNRLIQREIMSKEGNDGILTAKEISQMSFKGLEIVVLSACETALGDIDYNGVSGLQRGFKQAGANTILMSLDKVDDEATKILMVEFYRNLMDGKTKHQSLKSAQNYLRKYENGKYDDPKYWASFIMLDGLN